MSSTGSPGTYWQGFWRTFRVGLFLALISIPLYGRLRMDGGDLKRAERFEKKTFQTFASLTAGSLADFPDRFEALWNEHFGHRLWLAKMFARIRWNVFGVTPSDHFVAGKEGFFFQISARERSDSGEEVSLQSMLDANLGFHPLSASELQEWTNAIAARKAYLDKKNFEYLFTVAPDKAVIYSDKLPDSFDVKGPGRAEQLLLHLQSKGLPIVNLVAALKQKRDQLEYPLFLKTDAHWNKPGAFVAYQAVMNQADHGTPTLFSQYRVREDRDWYHRGFSSQIGFPMVESFYRLKHKGKRSVMGNSRFAPLLADQFDAPVSDRVHVKKKRSKAVVRIDGIRKLRMSVLFNPAATDYDLIIVYGDSFVAKMIWFLAEHSKVLLHVKTTNTFPTAPLESLRAANADRKVLFIQELAEKYLVNRKPEVPPQSH